MKLFLFLLTWAFALLASSLVFAGTVEHTFKVNWLPYLILFCSTSCGIIYNLYCFVCFYKQFRAWLVLPWQNHSVTL